MTTEPRRRVRISLAAFSVVVLLAGGALALAPLKGSEKGVKPVPKADASWADVDRFVKEQKYEEAAKSAEALLSAARAKGDEKAARETLKYLVEKYPSSRYATVAREELEVAAPAP